MGNVLRSPNGKALVLIPRSGSHSLAALALSTWWPDIKCHDNSHPAACLPIFEMWNGQNENTAMIVRNPVERFRSMIAHRNLDISLQLVNPIYGPIPTGNFIKLFRFENNGLEQCAEWLGLPTPLPQLDATEENNKPILTLEQEALVRQIYAKDIELWESLNG